MSDTLTGGPKTIAQKARDLGWTVEIQRANEHLFLGAMHPQGKVGFKATYANNRFLDAHLADPFGIPVECQADYTIDKRYAKTLGLSPAETARIEARRDHEYNDGEDRMVRRHYTKRATFLTDWLNQWLSVVNPAKAPKPRKTKAAAQPEPLTLENGEWNG